LPSIALSEATRQFWAHYSYFFFAIVLFGFGLLRKSFGVFAGVHQNCAMKNILLASDYKTMLTTLLTDSYIRNLLFYVHIL